MQVHYTGALDDGTLFDSEYGGGEPLAFVVGANQTSPPRGGGSCGHCGWSNGARALGGF